MALRPLQATMPLGQFDGIDTYATSLLGGEVVTFVGTVVPPGDKASYDSFDGYAAPTSRPAVTPLGRNSTAATARPLMLADEGIAGYGTLFGSVVGGTVGQVSTGGAVLGPHTATGSGKVTCWAQPGLYAVSLNATSLSASTAISVGARLYATVADTSAAGFLTTTSASNVVVGSFVEYASNGSLVNTPNYLTQALNSPSGASALTRTYDFVVLYFDPALAATT